jgi:hypothetical protein
VVLLELVDYKLNVDDASGKKAKKAAEKEEKKAAEKEDKKKSSEKANASETA